MTDPLKITPKPALVSNTRDSLGPHAGEWEVYTSPFGMGIEAHFRNKGSAALYCDAHNTYQKDPTLPSELLRQRDAAVMHLRNMFDGFDFESGLGKPEAADAENAWNFLNTLKPTDHE